MAKILIVIFLVAWFANSHVLTYIFPNVSIDWDEYVKFIAARNITYESMFLLLLVIIFITSKYWLKAFSCFGMILVTGSIIDKAVFNYTTYLFSDFLLIGIAIIASMLVYGRDVDGNEGLLP